MRGLDVFPVFEPLIVGREFGPGFVHCLFELRGADRRGEGKLEIKRQKAKLQRKNQKRKEKGREWSVERTADRRQYLGKGRPRWVAYL
jgi:hypothetical protein